MSKRKKEKAMQAAQAATVLVDNPMAIQAHEVKHRHGETYYRPDQIVVALANKDDPLGQMLRRRQINKAQERAGRLYQTTYEAARGLRSRSPSELREHVDGGPQRLTGTTDEQMRASDLLNGWNAVLGHDKVIAEAFLIHKMSIREIADASRQMIPGKASTTFHGHLVRRLLTMLAERMGFGG